MVRDTYTLEPRAAEVTLGLDHLRRLHRELRDLVYGHAISDGNMAPVRASKQVYIGVCRLNLGSQISSTHRPRGYQPKRIKISTFEYALGRALGASAKKISIPCTCLKAALKGRHVMWRRIVTLLTTLGWAVHRLSTS